MSGIKQTLQDQSNSYSSKRVFVLIILLTIVGIAIATVVFGKKVDQFLFEGLIEAFVWGLVSISSEHVANAFGKNKFSLGKKREDEDLGG